MDAHLHCKIPTLPFHCAASNSRFKLCVGKTAERDEENYNSKFSNRFPHIMESRT